MTIAELEKLAVEVSSRYRTQGAEAGEKPWNGLQYVASLAGDFGDLSKLVMKKEGYRVGESIDDKLAHEISDCLWCLLVLANRYEINLEGAFVKTMKEIHSRIDAGAANGN